MSVTELQHRLFSDLRDLRLPVDEVEVFFRPFSKTYYGRYFPATQTCGAKMHIYPLASPDGAMLDYDTVLDTAIHEFCHHIQYADGLVRVKGVMHNEQFWRLYNHYKTRAREMRLIERCVS